ncbi:hypothetical protein LGH70_20860 [Hymenobacter sp. BT635]|uniref:Uncharacterized protein n=1 Tax=Hymenobacter nitidus TaxID=2880929 RepID=A0ABS8AHY6_9BACT|nr:hypothetical protein [Hymenobacter nitidus]MCB2380058.1 hypothetical protein [Hymenobacter nitidus]
MATHMTQVEKKQLSALKALTKIMETFMASHPDFADMEIEELSFRASPVSSTVKSREALVAEKRTIRPGYHACKGPNGVTIYKRNGIPC